MYLMSRLGGFGVRSFGLQVEGEAFDRCTSPSKRGQYDSTSRSKGGPTADSAPPPPQKSLEHPIVKDYTLEYSGIRGMFYGMFLH